MPWPFRRKHEPSAEAPATAGSSAPDATVTDASAAVVLAERDPAALEARQRVQYALRRDWATLPPLPTAAGPAPVTIATSSFLDTLASRMKLPGTFEPRSRSTDAPGGVMVDAVAGPPKVLPPVDRPVEPAPGLPAVHLKSAPIAASEPAPVHVPAQLSLPTTLIEVRAPLTSEEQADLDAEAMFRAAADLAERMGLPVSARARAVEQPRPVREVPAGPLQRPTLGQSRRLGLGSPVVLPEDYLRPPDQRRRVERVPAEVRDAVLDATGVDVSETPVIRGPEAGSQARALGARAFAREGEVFLPDEAGEIDSPEARGLLAHELVHVAQQQEHGPALPEEHTPEGLVLEAQARQAEAAVRGEPGVPLPRRATRVDDPEAVTPLLSTGLARQERDGTLVFVPPPRAGSRVQRAGEYDWQRTAVQQDPEGRSRLLSQSLSARGIFASFVDRGPATDDEQTELDEGFERTHIDSLRRARRRRLSELREEATRAERAQEGNEIWERTDTASEQRRREREERLRSRAREEEHERAQRVREAHREQIQSRFRGRERTAAMDEYDNLTRGLDEALQRYHTLDEPLTDLQQRFTTARDEFQEERALIQQVDRQRQLRQPELDQIRNPVPSPTAMVEELDRMEVEQEEARRTYDARKRELETFIRARGLTSTEGGGSAVEQLDVGGTTGTAPTGGGGRGPRTGRVGTGMGPATTPTGALGAAAMTQRRAGAGSGTGGSTPGATGGDGAPDFAWQEGQYSGSMGDRVRGLAQDAFTGFLDTFRRPFMSDEAIEREDRQRATAEERERAGELREARRDLLEEKLEDLAQGVARDLRELHPDTYGGQDISAILPRARGMLTRAEVQEAVNRTESERPLREIAHPLAQEILNNPRFAVFRNAPEETPRDRLDADALRRQLQQARTGGAPGTTTGAPGSGATPGAGGATAPGGGAPAERGGTTTGRAGTAGSSPVGAGAAAGLPSGVAPRFTAARTGDPERSVISEQRGGEVDLDLINMEELSRRVYLRLRSRLRTELLVDRERAGLLSDFR